MSNAGSIGGMKVGAEWIALAGLILLSLAPSVASNVSVDFPWSRRAW